MVARTWRHDCHGINRDDEGAGERYMGNLSPPAGRSGLGRHVDRTPRGLFPSSDRPECDRQQPL